MIAITGANGQLGQLVITNLLTKTAASNIVALVRNLDNAQALTALGVVVRQADYDKPATLTSALVGVSKLLLISGSEVGQRLAQHQAVIDAAKAAGVALFAYTSILKADSSPLLLAQEHKATEQQINASGLPAVILRNGWYTENYTQGIEGALNSGSIAGSADQGIFSTAARNDYAEAAAVILTSNENHVGKVYELAGDDGFTLSDYAAEITKQTGKEIKYDNLSAQELTSLLMSFGLNEGFATCLVDAELNAATGWLADTSKTLSKLIGRATTPLTQSITQML
ncbi:MAG: SDR family oxidoreductase [Gammaproteobacteria bacterium]|nr:SDR family oxidoreductase [Gammaproteobacteria bacterium]